ncbi:hypothetical protein SRHO_G00003470 [Serrasalmus rhombeus]
MAQSLKDKAISTFGGRYEEIASSLTAAGEATVSPRLAPSPRFRFGVARRCCVRSTKVTGGQEFTMKNDIFSTACRLETLASLRGDVTATETAGCDLPLVELKMAKTCAHSL